MTTDWVHWHRDYDQPNSSLAQRLRVVRTICAGDGRDVLPMLATHARPVRALLVELDPRLAGRARTTATQLGLHTVAVRATDAGLTDPYIDIAPRRSCWPAASSATSPPNTSNARSPPRPDCSPATAS